ncbi:MAG TPA: response regulator [Terriglobales bacterium]|nr:response regulator [Terriglobales bacterium]
MASAQPKFRYRILIADDDEIVRSTVSALLISQNYEVLVAEDGFEALALMRAAPPDLVISDLKMPNMSGFELLGIIRKRFPSVAVIVMSGEFTPVSVPPDLLADRYLEKSHTPPLEIVEVVREVLASSPIRSQPAKSELSPVWLPRSRTAYIVLTCVECLRSFSIPQQAAKGGRRLDETCPHCGSTVQYCLDVTMADGPSGTSRVDDMRKQVESSKGSIEESKRLIHDHKRRIS